MTREERKEDARVQGHRQRKRSRRRRRNLVEESIVTVTEKEQEKTDIEKGTGDVEQLGKEQAKEKGSNEKTKEEVIKKLNDLYLPSEEEKYIHIETQRTRKEDRAFLKNIKKEKLERFQLAGLVQLAKEYGVKDLTSIYQVAAACDPEYYNIDLVRRKPLVDDEARNFKPIQIANPERMDDKTQKERAAELFEKLLADIQESILTGEGKESPFNQRIALGVDINDAQWNATLREVIIREASPERQELVEILRQATFQIYSRSPEQQDREELESRIRSDPLDLIRVMRVAQSRYKSKEGRELDSSEDCDIHQPQGRDSIVRFIDELQYRGRTFDNASTQYLNAAKKWVASQGYLEWDRRDGPTVEIFKSLSNHTPTCLLQEHCNDWYRVTHTSTGPASGAQGYRYGEIVSILTKANNPVMYKGGHFYNAWPWESDVLQRTEEILTRLTCRIMKLRNELWSKIGK